MKNLLTTGRWGETALKLSIVWEVFLAGFLFLLEVHDRVGLSKHGLDIPPDNCTYHCAKIIEKELSLRSASVILIAIRTESLTD